MANLPSAETLRNIYMYCHSCKVEKQYKEKIDEITSLILSRIRKGTAEFKIAKEDHEEICMYLIMHGYEVQEREEEDGSVTMLISWRKSE